MVFYTIREAERGVVLRFGEYHEQVEPGLRWAPTFIDSVIPVDVQSIRDQSSSGSMLTEDEKRGKRSNGNAISRCRPISLDVCR